MTIFFPCYLQPFAIFASLNLYSEDFVFLHQILFIKKIKNYGIF